MRTVLTVVAAVVFCASAVFAQEEQRKIAVYVENQTELDRGVESSLRERIEHTITKKTSYVVVDRSEEYERMRDREMVKQLSGAVDDDQIIALGREAGVHLMCVVRIGKVFTGYQISARTVDIETSIRQVGAAGITSAPSLKSLQDFETVSEELIAQMFGRTITEAIAKRVKVGGRLAVNNTHAAGLSFTVDDYDGNSITSTTYDNKMGMSSFGGEFGVIIDVALTRTLSLNAGANIVFRNPVDADVVTISEGSLSVPALLRMRLKNSGIYFEGGVQLDVPFLGSLERKGQGSFKHEERASVGFDVVAGAGLFLNSNWAVDLRGSVGLNSYDTEPGHITLLQFSVGVSALY